MTYNMQTRYNPEAFCYHCGADWTFWFTSDDDQKEKALDENPEADVSNLVDSPRPKGTRILSDKI